MSELDLHNVHLVVHPVGFAKSLRTLKTPQVVKTS